VSPRQPAAFALSRLEGGRHVNLIWNMHTCYATTQGKYVALGLRNVPVSAVAAGKTRLPTVPRGAPRSPADDGRKRRGHDSGTLSRLIETNDLSKMEELRI
jgi:hypothetical protein